MARIPPVVRILERLAREPTTSFHEERVAAQAVILAKGFGARVRRDRFGNVRISPPQPRKGPPVWLVAHMDHPGVEMTGKREAVLLGGLAPAYFRRGTRLRFYQDGEAVTARVRGYSGTTYRFRLAPSPEVDRLRRRDMGVFELEDFAVGGGLVHARQLDDLAGSSVSLAVMERACRDRRPNLHALLTRAEEEGFVGTLAAIADEEIPRNAIIINVEASKAIPGVEIGGGPVIRVGDRRKSFDPLAESRLLAARSKLPKTRPVQRGLMPGGTCEATPWGLFGWRATGVAIPLGNYHNQGPRNRLAAEIVSVKDLATAVDLIEVAARDRFGAERWDDATRRMLNGYLRRLGPRLAKDS
jgi:putative aminopeptidase FrvX